MGQGQGQTGQGQTGQGQGPGPGPGPAGARAGARAEAAARAGGGGVIGAGRKLWLRELLGRYRGGGPATVTLKRSIYTLSVDPGTHLAAWAAYRVTRASIGKSPRRKWRRDPDLPPAGG